MPNDSKIFEILNLQLSYGLKRRVAVRELSLDLLPGAAMGFLGLNGAGKTSTIRALLGMLRPDRGTVSVFGDKPAKLETFRRLGFAPEEGLPPEYLTGEEYLKFVGAFRIPDKKKCQDECRELMNWFELQPDKRIRDYSKGMKRRLLLAQAFLGSPAFMILDEPLNGLDPIFIIKLRERVEMYRKAGGSVLLSSHILTEVEKTCTEIAVIHGGELVGRGPVEKYVQEYGSVETAFTRLIGKS